MNRRQLLGGLGAFASVLALPHAGWAVDWPTQAYPIIAYDGKTPQWFAISGRIEDMQARWSDEFSAWLMPHRKGDPYTAFMPFFSRTHALRWSRTVAENGAKPLAIVQSGTCDRPPRFFNGQYGAVVGSGFLAGLNHSAAPLRATWYEGQGL